MAVHPFQQRDAYVECEDNFRVPNYPFEDIPLGERNYCCYAHRASPYVRVYGVQGMFTYSAMLKLYRSTVLRYDTIK